MITLSISFVEETAEGDWIPTTMPVVFDTEDTDQAYELADRWVSIEADKSLKHMIAGTLRMLMGRYFQLLDRSNTRAIHQGINATQGAGIQKVTLVSVNAGERIMVRGECA